jgi:hypothetical protein
LARINEKHTKTNNNNNRFLGEVDLIPVVQALNDFSRDMDSDTAAFLALLESELNKV